MSPEGKIALAKLAGLGSLALQGVAFAAAGGIPFYLTSRLDDKGVRRWDSTQRLAKSKPADKKKKQTYTLNDFAKNTARRMT